MRGNRIEGNREGCHLALHREDGEGLVATRRGARLQASLADHLLRRSGTIIDLDRRVKRRDPEAPIRVALNDVRCPRCNGHGRTRVVGLSWYPSV